MDPNSGRLYTIDEVQQMPTEEQDKLVEIRGTEEQVRAVSEAVKAHRRAKNKAARRARKAARK